LRIPLKEGIGGERRPKGQGKDRVTLRITVLAHYCIGFPTILLGAITHFPPDLQVPTTPTNVSHLNLETGCTRARLFDLFPVALTLYTCNCQVWVLSKCVLRKNSKVNIKNPCAIIYYSWLNEWQTWKRTLRYHLWVIRAYYHSARKWLVQMWKHFAN
jgi:hypothetical protein